MSSIKLNKLEAARLQLESAIKLLFDGDSIISVHTLCSASFNILKDISKLNDGDFAFEMEIQVKPEYINLFWNKHANFCKHADRDPNDSLEFSAEATHVKMLFSCWGYKEIAGRRTPILDGFCKWMLAIYPHYFKLNEKERKHLEPSVEAIKNDLREERQKLSFGRTLINLELGNFKNPSPE